MKPLDSTGTPQTRLGSVGDTVGVTSRIPASAERHSHYFRVTRRLKTLPSEGAC